MPERIEGNEDIADAALRANAQLLEQRREVTRAEIEELALIRIAEYEERTKEQTTQARGAVEQVIAPWWEELVKSGDYQKILQELLASGKEKISVTEPFVQSTPWVEVLELDSARREQRPRFGLLVDEVITTSDPLARGRLQSLRPRSSTEIGPPLSAERVLSLAKHGALSETWFALGFVPKREYTPKSRTENGILVVHRHFQDMSGIVEPRPLNLSEPSVSVVFRIGPESILGFADQIVGGKVDQIIAKRSQSYVRLR